MKGEVRYSGRLTSGKKFFSSLLLQVNYAECRKRLVLCCIILGWMALSLRTVCRGSPPPELAVCLGSFLVRLRWSYSSTRASNRGGGKEREAIQRRSRRYIMDDTSPHPKTFPPPSSSRSPKFVFEITGIRHQGWLRVLFSPAMECARH